MGHHFSLLLAAGCGPPPVIISKRLLNAAVPDGSAERGNSAQLLAILARWAPSPTAGPMAWALPKSKSFGVGKRAMLHLSARWRRRTTFYWEQTFAAQTMVAKHVEFGQPHQISIAAAKPPGLHVVMDG